jgi:hypothetical protein
MLFSLGIVAASVGFGVSRRRELLESLRGRKR